jgi:GTP-binding protein
MGDHAPGGREDLSPVPADADADEEALKAGRRLFAQPCRFVAGAATSAQIPADALPEVAFAGRSNVGKSSLINALTGRGGLAKTSVTPGRTQQLNFFDLGGRLMLADLPGYGYAKAPKAEVDRWTRLVYAYLKGRAPLRRVLLLIDSRHGLKAGDRHVMALLDRAGVNYQAVLTKADKIPAAALEAVLCEVTAELAKRTAGHPRVLATSAETGAGIAEVRTTLAALALDAGR